MQDLQMKIDTDLQMRLCTDLQMKLGTDLQMKFGTAFQMKLGSDLQMKFGTALQMKLGTDFQMKFGTYLQIKFVTDLQKHFGSNLQMKFDRDLQMEFEVMEYLDIDVLVNTMTEAYMAYEESSREDEELDNLLQGVGFQYYHLIARKMDLDPSVTPILKTEDQVSAFDYYKGSTLSIEIVKDDIMQKMYFRVKDKKVLREEIKDKFKYEVDRTSPSNKIRDFMDWSSDIIKDIKYQRRVHANPVGRLLTKILPLNNMFMLIIFAIIMLIVFAITLWITFATTLTYLCFANSDLPVFCMLPLGNMVKLNQHHHVAKRQHAKSTLLIIFATTPTYLYLCFATQKMLMLPLNYMVMLITLAITMVVLVTWEADDTKPSYIPGYRFSGGSTAIYVLGGIHNLLSLAIFISYVVSNRPTFPSFADIVSVCRKKHEAEDESEGTWNDKQGESHLEMKAYGVKTIYYVK
ncbi:FMR1-like protein [Mya arenaria]|uniref:FMR1-like protein n=1 Tax=Mya arenaria TaxID=6604 RepID=A0ABY7G3U4_MYAAR|nr:FMR1-like protein [Mya arenaria]